MSDHPELSQLPDDDAYWEALEARIVASLGDPVAEARSVAAYDAADVGVIPFAPRAVDPWAPLTAHAYELAAFAVAAAAAVAFLVPPPLSVGAAPAANVAATLLTPPSDETALMASLTAESPPALGQLVLPITVNTEEESR